MGGDTCIQGHPQMPKRILCKLKRGTLHTKFVKTSRGHVSPVPRDPMSMFVGIFHGTCLPCYTVMDQLVNVITNLGTI